MADEWTLHAAVVSIAEADVGAGGLVELHGKPHPVVQWGDKGMGEVPRTAIEVFVTDRGRGTGGVLKGTLRLNAFVPDGAGPLETDILNRFEDQVTTPALMTHGIDATIQWGARPDLTGLEKRGSGRRRALVGKFTMKR